MTTGIDKGVPCTVNLRFGNGMAFGLVALLVFIANLLLWHAGPGLNWGLYAIAIAGLTLVSRRRIVWDRTLVLLLILLVVSAVQTVRFLSMANFLTLNTLLFAILGHTTYSSLEPFWTRIMQAGFAPWNWVGIWQTIERFSIVGVKASDDLTAKQRLFLILRIVIPALLIVPVFAVLLSFGNAVMGSIIEKWIDAVFAYLNFEWLTVGWWFFSGAVALTGVVFLRSGNAIGNLQRLSKPWIEIGEQDSFVRSLQWVVLLLLLNALFGFSTVLDVVFLWFSKSLPEGIGHSRYVHEGVYVLIFTTVLSATLMALLTQHTAAVRNHKWIKLLAYFWMFQNLLLISGVFLKLYIYVDAYGYTPKRVYVACFLLLELYGFATLLWALWKQRGIQWLLGRNLVAVFVYFFLLQLWNVNGFIVDKNFARFQRGELQYPEWRLVDELGTEGARYIDLLLDDATTADEIRELWNLQTLLNQTFAGQMDHDWRAFQVRRSKNIAIYRALELKMKEQLLRLELINEAAEFGMKDGPDTAQTSDP